MFRTLATSLVLLAGLLLTGCASTSNDYLRLQADAHDGAIAEGDTITVVDELRPDVVLASAKVPADGRVILPELGLVQVGGYTARELRQELARRYRGVYEDTDLTITVLGPHGRYYVFGEVARPGRKPLDGDLTLYEAVQQAAPVQNYANLGQVRLVRGEGADEVTMVVDVLRMQRGDTTFNVRLLDGDIVYVPSTAVGNLTAPLRSEPTVDEPVVRRYEVRDEPLEASANGGGTPLPAAAGCVDQE